LYVKLHVSASDQFENEGQNLKKTLAITISEAALGTKKKIKTLDDSEVNLKIPAGITHGELLKVKGKGIPDRRGSRGDLLVRIRIRIPDKLSGEQKKLLAKLKESGL
jgi:molecular chaperone DnaJ